MIFVHFFNIIRQTWIIPLSYYTNYQVNDEYSVIFVTERSQNITVKVNTSNSMPIKFNKDSQGYYIVNYPVEDWQKWIDLLQRPQAMTALKLTAQDYSQLLYDAFLLAGTNLLPYNISLALTSLLSANEMFSVWYTGSTVFSQLWPFFRTNHTVGTHSLMQTVFRRYAQLLVNNNYRKYGLQSGDPESIVSQRLRSQVSSFACAYGLDLCLLEAQVEFKKWRFLNKTLSPNIRATVFRYAIQESKDSSDWHYLWTTYINVIQTSFKLDCLQGLAQTSNKDFLKLYVFFI